MNASTAIVVAGVAIALSLLVTNRYAVVSGGERSVWRVNQITGQVTVCIIRGAEMVCFEESETK